MFNQVLQHVAQDYVDTLADTAIYRRAVEGVIEELHDPHSTYLSPKLLNSLNERTTGKYAGVGAQVDVRDGWPVIVSPLPGGPAIAAGIQAGDRITEVDGKPMHGVSIEETQKALRGTPGSVVKLTIERPGLGTPLKFALTRNEIRVRSVQHATLLGDGIGYVALSVFSEESAPDLKHVIDSLRNDRMKTLIFDLRGDPGGLLNQGVAIADLFLDRDKPIVTMKGRTPEISKSFADIQPQFWPDLSLIVLVDSGSASAAEIVAGALQDHDRAVLIGTTTYGKGSAQNVFPLSDGGAVKLTTALWFTPSGRSINRRRASEDDEAPVDTSMAARPKFKTDAGRTVLGGGGITPDVTFSMPAQSAADSALQRALGKQIPQFRDALTDYALSIKASKAVKSPDFTVTPEMHAELYRRMRARGITLDERIYQGASSLIDRALGYEIARYSFGEAGEYARRLRDDAMVARAVAFARGAKTQAELLSRVSRPEP
jgi:carboxyl-terminal processing protease